MLVSRVSGSVRGVDGGVEKILKALRRKSERVSSSPVLRRLREEEEEEEESQDGECGKKKGKVVLYVTSVKAIRKTHEMCKQVLHILRALQVSITVKDVFLHPDYSKELAERLGGSTTNGALPQLFVAGKYIGDGEIITEMNEKGELEPLLERYKMESGTLTKVCKCCAGERFVTCSWCKGSKKGVKTVFGVLKCTVCNPNGLQLCPECSSS